MVGGTIKDYFIIVSHDEYSNMSEDLLIVKFLVQDKNDYCTVSAKIPKEAIEFNLVKIGQPIWWHNPKVLIKIEETHDVEFDKFGFSGGDYDSFYRDKQNNL